MNRNLIFRHYWWFTPPIAIALALWAWHHGGDERLSLIGAILAGTLGFCYFIQQQKLAETALFKDLFIAFNERYDSLNNELSDIASFESIKDNVQRNKVIDYFNLCAEEYLFYKEGYIPREVWRSWCRGMKWYLDKKAFLEVWEEEIQTESYYGLSLKIINKGAA